MTTATSEKIGFIGLGHMGHGMAKNIVDKGYALTVMGRSRRAPVDDLRARGAAEAKSAAELATRSTWPGSSGPSATSSRWSISEG